MGIESIKKELLKIFFKPNLFQESYNRFICQDDLLDFLVTFLQDSKFQLVGVTHNVFYDFVYCLDNFEQLVAHPWIFLEKLIFKLLNYLHNLCFV